MNETPDESASATQDSIGGSSYRRAAPHKEYDVSESKPKAFMVEDAQWERLQGRVKAIEEEPSISWLTNAGWTAFSVSASAVLAVVVLPQSKGTQLGSGVRPGLWAIAIAAFAVGVIASALYVWSKYSRRSSTTDICAEMDTIHEAWVERKSEADESA
jgi:hypothetical protein